MLLRILLCQWYICTGKETRTLMSIGLDVSSRSNSRSSYASYPKKPNWLTFLHPVCVCRLRSPLQENMISGMSHLTNSSHPGM